MLAGILSLPNESVSLYSLYSLMHTQTCEFAKSLLAHELWEMATSYGPKVAGETSLSLLMDI